jgi:hypothetical protein
LRALKNMLDRFQYVRQVTAKKPKNKRGRRKKKERKRAQASLFIFLQNMLFLLLLLSCPQRGLLQRGQSADSPGTSPAAPRRSEISRAATVDFGVMRNKRPPDGPVSGAQAKRPHLSEIGSHGKQHTNITGRMRKARAASFPCLFPPVHLALKCTGPRSRLHSDEDEILAKLEEENRALMQRLLETTRDLNVVLHRNLQGRRCS